MVRYREYRAALEVWLFYTWIFLCLQVSSSTYGRRQPQHAAQPHSTQQQQYRQQYRQQRQQYGQQQQQYGQPQQQQGPDTQPRGALGAGAAPLPSAALPATPRGAAAAQPPGGFRSAVDAMAARAAAGAAVRGAAGASAGGAMRPASRAFSAASDAGTNDEWWGHGSGRSDASYPLTAVSVT